MKQPKQKVSYCGHGRFAAVQCGNEITLTASGWHNSSGWTSLLRLGPEDSNPPIYHLGHIAPTGTVFWRMTQFEVSVTFNSDEEVEALTVKDADGEHEVPVVQRTLDASEYEAGLMGGDPFPF